MQEREFNNWEGKRCDAVVVEAKCNVYVCVCVWGRKKNVFPESLLSEEDTTKSAYFMFPTMLNALLSEVVPHV